MPTKYILKPDGTVITSEGASESFSEVTKQQTSASSKSNNLFTSNATDVTSVLFMDSFPGSDNNVNDKVTNIVDNNPNFNFADGDRDTIKSFKQIFK